MYLKVLTTSSVNVGPTTSDHVVSMSAWAKLYGEEAVDHTVGPPLIVTEISKLNAKAIDSTCYQELSERGRFQH